MKKHTLYVVKVNVMVHGEEFNGVDYFDRIPTTEEFLAALEDERPSNSHYRPGHSSAVFDLVSRAGLPTPFPEPEPYCTVATVFSYPDGWVSVQRIYRYAMDEEG